MVSWKIIQNLKVVVVILLVVLLIVVGLQFVILFVGLFVCVSVKCVEDFFQLQFEEKWKQWFEVCGDWNMGLLEVLISVLYDNFMYDLCVWFKLLGDDDDVWNYNQIKVLKMCQVEFECEYVEWKKCQ